MTKLDRMHPRSVPSTNGRAAEKSHGASHAQAVAAPAAPTAEGAVTGRTDFAQLAAALAQLQVRQAHVGRSADPGALWGGHHASDNHRARFTAAATPAERKAVVAEVKAEQAKCESKISERTEKLERRWKRMNGGKREVILRDYIEKAAARPELKAKVEAAATQSAAMQAEIDALAAKLKATYPAKTPAEDTARRELKKELVELRKHQREVLNAVTDQLSAAGMKLELLATNEKAIDTTGTITKGEESLLSLIGKWLGFNQTLSFFDHFLEQNKINLEEQRRRIEAEQVEKAVHEGDLRKKLQLQSDMAQRDALKQLSERIDGVRKG